MNEETGKSKVVTRVLQAPFSSRYALAALVGVLAAAAGLGYWSRGRLASAFSSTEEVVVTTLGLGVAPIVLLLVAFLLVLIKRRSWLRRVNLWVGALTYAAFILGVLSFFEPSRGALAAFTLDGDVSLGGEVGSALAGPVAWLGVLRVVGIFVVATAITAPSLAVDMALGSWRLSVLAYAFSVVAVRGTTSALRHIYRFEPETRFAKSEEAAGSAESLIPTRDPSMSLGARRRDVPARRTDEVAGSMRAAMPEAPDKVEASTSLARTEADVDTEGDFDRAEEPETEIEPAAVDLVFSGETPKPAVGRYNKFWGRRPDVDEERNGHLQEQAGAGDTDRSMVASGPVLDSTAPSWERPGIDLLEEAPEGGISEGQMEETGETIKRTLAEYGVEVEIGQIKPGPTVSMYGLIPGWVRRHKQVKVTDEHGNPKLDESGRPAVARVETKTRVKVDTIMSREKDLALALKTPSIRIETPVLGESLVGIEVPNPAPNLVTLRSVMESDEFKKLRATAALPIALGKGTGGETVLVDLAKMPHLLIAGATGSGKSVCINTIVSCLIREKTPEEMRLLLVDPKRVELTPYNGIPHLLTKVVVETDQVVALLKGLIQEMLNRYRMMEEVGVRNIQSYNERMPEKMPYLVVAIDELADLMMSASFDVEQSLCRLAQLGRATGIHLVIATQRPSVDVVTGLIKANFPSRVSFGVSSQIDSRTILDTAGAEKLLGRGDMLYLAMDASVPERVQGVFISDREIERLVHFWQATPWGPVPKVSLNPVKAEATDEDSDEEDVQAGRDQLLGKAIELAQRYKKLSTSLLQRRMRIGYPRAARLMDQLEEEGIVGPGDGSKSRDVIMNKM